jgi:hypothetical protein
LPFFFINSFTQNGNHFPQKFFEPLLLFQEQENQETKTNPAEQRDQQPLLSKINPNPTLNQPKTLHPNKNPGPLTLWLMT